MSGLTVFAHASEIYFDFFFVFPFSSDPTVKSVGDPASNTRTVFIRWPEEKLCCLDNGFENDNYPFVTERSVCSASSRTWTHFYVRQEGEKSIFRRSSKTDESPLCSNS